MRRALDLVTTDGRERGHFLRGLVGAAALVQAIGCSEPPAQQVGSAVGLHARVRVGDAEFVSEEAEIRLDPPGERDPATPRTAARDARPQLTGPHLLPGAPSPILASRKPRTPPPTGACAVGQPAEKIGTIDGSICWVNVSLTSGSLIEENALYQYVIFGREGIYKATQVSMNIYYPPDFGHFGAGTAVGCAKSPDGEFITREYLASMSAFAVTYGMGPFVVGFTTFIVPGRRFVPALEYDTGYGVTASLIPWPIAVSLNLMENSSYATPPTLIAPWNDGCGPPAPPAGPGLRAAGGGPLATIAAGLHALQSAGGDDDAAILRRALASELAPVFDLLATPTGAPPTDDEPASTQADLFASWLARGDGDGLCADCPAMSIDHLLYEIDRQVVAAGDDSEAILQASIEAADRQVQISPQWLEQAALQRRMSPGVALAEVLADTIIAGSDPDRRVDTRIVVIPAEVGAAADLSITADEIADLVGLDPAALAGATVTIDASPIVDPASLEIVEGEAKASFTPRDTAPLLFRYAVDLSTAAGPLPPGAESWVVRPAMRRLEPASGPPAQVLLTAPYRATAGEPVVLSALVLDAAYTPLTGAVAVEFLDGDDQPLATAEGQSGAATAVVVPTPSLPAITEVVPTTLKYGDDSTGPGFAIKGTGFSREAVVRIDGRTLEQLDLLHAVRSSHEILFEDDGSFAGAHRLVVENPHGTASAAARFTGP